MQNGDSRREMEKQRSVSAHEIDVCLYVPEQRSAAGTETGPENWNASLPALFFFTGQGISCSLERPKSFPRLSSTLYFLAKSKMSVGRQCDGASAGYERCCLSQRGTEGLLATITTGAVRRKASFQARHAILGVFALLTLFVILTRDRTLLDSGILSFG